VKKIQERRQPPIDPRLWKASRSARRYLVLSVVVGVLIATQMIVVAWCIARVTAGIITQPTHRHISDWALELSLLAAMIVLRAVTGWVQDRYAHRAAGRVVLDLRLSLLRAARHTNPRVLAAHRDELRTVATSGLDGLPTYLISYIPALMLAVTVSPLTWIAILCADWRSAVIIAITIPLIPIFMILVGKLTEERTRRHLESMKTLSSTLLDLVAGLPTLISLGREKGPARTVRRIGQEHFNATMASLRIAFLSSAVLELLSTLCVALVAVELGFRLMGYTGEVPLFNAIFVLILVAEVYKPLRTVGSKFHDSEDGQYAADRAFTAIALAEEKTQHEPDSVEREPAALSPASRIDVTDLTITSRGGYAPYQLSFTAEPGHITVLTGANGVGKSTSLLTILGMPGMMPEDSGIHGTVLIDGHPVRNIPTEYLWEHMSWLPQRPAIIAGTVRDNLLGSVTSIGRSAGPSTDPSAGNITDAIVQAAQQTGFNHVIEQLPDGYDTWLGSGGIGLSLGQRQRLALTRTLADTTRHVILLDEPTAHLDGEAEDRVIARLRERAAAGDTILIVGHRDKLLQAADTVVNVHRRDREEGQ